MGNRRVIGPYRSWAMGPCFYCGKVTYRTGINPKPDWAYTRDHLIPLRLRTSVYTLLSHHLTTVTCCYDCNTKKGCLSAQEFINKYMSKERHKRIGWKQIASVYRMNAQ